MHVLSSEQVRSIVCNVSDRTPGTIIGAYLAYWQKYIIDPGEREEVLKINIGGNVPK